MKACDDVDFVLERGRIHGVLGENGAGKSTLMKILIGLVLPDEGSIAVDGSPVQIHDPLAAARLGIGMVHQHFSLVDALTVWENVALGEDGALRPHAVRQRIAEIGDRFGLEIDPEARVGDLTAGLRQRVEIIKCLRRDPSIVIFDEPTSVLTPEESQQLFSSFREVVAVEGRAVVLVSHKLDEVLAATDEITIMRRGAVVDRRATANADASSLARAMVGREVSLRSEQAAFGLISESDEVEERATLASSSTPALDLRDVIVDGPGGVRLLDGISLRVGPGEIVGIAGVEGNGQFELCTAIAGLRPSTGSVIVDGRDLAHANTRERHRAGLAYIPFDRQREGLMLNAPLWENTLLGREHEESLSKGPFIDAEAARASSVSIIDRFGVLTPNETVPAFALSGGNQQKLVVGRNLVTEPAVLIAAHPTRGIDVGAQASVWDQIRDHQHNDDTDDRAHDRTGATPGRYPRERDDRKSGQVECRGRDADAGLDCVLSLSRPVDVVGPVEPFVDQRSCVRTRDLEDRVVDSCQDSRGQQEQGDDRGGEA